MSSYIDSSIMSGNGRRHRRHRRVGGSRKTGRGILSDLIGSVGLGRRRRKVGGTRRKIGMGIWDKIKSGLKFAAPIVASAALGKAGSALGSKVFGGRRRRRTHAPKVTLAGLVRKLKTGGRRRKHRKVGGAVSRRRAILI